MKRIKKEIPQCTKAKYEFRDNRRVDGMISIENHLTLYLESTREVVLWGGEMDFNKPLPAWTLQIS